MSFVASGELLSIEAVGFLMLFNDCALISLHFFLI